MDHLNEEGGGEEVPQVPIKMSKKKKEVEHFDTMPIMPRQTAQEEREAYNMLSGYNKKAQSMVVKGDGGLKFVKKGRLYGFEGQEHYTFNA